MPACSAAFLEIARRTSLALRLLEAGARRGAEPSRLERLRAALTVAGGVDAPVERAHAAEWIEDRLAQGERLAALKLTLWPAGDELLLARVGATAIPWSGWPLASRRPAPGL